jgi:hypothetical protein
MGSVEEKVCATWERITRAVHTGARDRVRRPRTMKPAFLCTSLVAACILAAAPSARASFGIADFSATATNENGSVADLAGSHPFAYSFDFAINTDAQGEAEGSLYSIEVELPPGLIGSSRAVPRCGGADFEGLSPRCPPETQVGVMRADAAGLEDPTLIPIYNLTPPLGYAAAFGVSAAGNKVTELVSLQGSGAAAHLRVSAIMPGGLGVKHVTQTLWGIPAESGHDFQRGACLESTGSCPADIAPAPLLTLPASCGPPLPTTLSVLSTEEPTDPRSATALSRGEGGEPQGMLGCEDLPFEPSVSVRPDAGALAPSGLSVDLDLPPAEAIPGRSSATLRELTLELPPGLAINPPAAAGLASCSAAQIGLSTPAGTLPARFDRSAPACPDAAKIGTLSAETPLLASPLSGPVYLAASGQNPFAATFAIYLVLSDPDSGTLIKVPGRLDPDPSGGRLTARIAEVPQIPFGHVVLRLFPGPRAILTTPAACGTYSTSADVLSSAAPEVPPAHLRSEFTLTGGPAAGPCPIPEASRTEPLGIEVGSLSARAAVHSPFILRLSRADTAPHLSSFDLTLPPGLLADLRTATCPDTLISRAAAAPALLEQSTPACPPDSAIGTVAIGAGVGPAPLHLSGRAYLSGPYKGAPFSLTAIVRAAAGPFDLGPLVERIALELDPRTAQLSAHADPLPQILAGVPLELRSLSIDFDRPGFTRNPTSCAPLAIDGSSISPLGQSLPLSERFQLGGCRALLFKPRLSLQLSGALGRNGHPSMHAVIKTRPDQASVSRAALTLPATELLEYANIREVCTRSRYATAGGGGERCPLGSRYGRARAFTPLLDRPLEGPLYLRANKDPHKLPDLVASLDGRLHLDYVAHVSSAHGLLRIALDHLPDVPVEKVVLQLHGGKGGLLVNTTDLCRAGPRFSATLLAHNRKRHTARPAVKLNCARTPSG